MKYVSLIIAVVGILFFLRWAMPFDSGGGRGMDLSIAQTILLIAIAAHFILGAITKKE